MTFDFTYKKYVDLIKAISESEYKVLTISDYISGGDPSKKQIIIRHDVDIDPVYQVKFAKMEHDHGIRTSYYFRYVDKVFKEEFIDAISEMGHEVGYHYEVFTKTKGNEAEAIDLFRKELAVYSEKWGSKTVCPHGGSFVESIDGYGLLDMIQLIPKLLLRKAVFSSWSNFDMWSKYKVEDFHLLGDAYSSIDFTDILYLSDTGRSWDNRYKRLDKVESVINPRFKIRKSDDIIKVIQKGEADKIYLLIHFEQWKDNAMDWITWYLAQLIRRTGKKLIFRM